MKKQEPRSPVSSPNLAQSIEKLTVKRQEIIRPILEHPREYVLLSVRAMAQQLKTDPATIVRIERGDTLSIGTVLKACIYIGCHPYSYFARPELAGQYLKIVSREIANQQSNKQEPENVAATVG